jgi:intein-encoded DNA endonuclease-like protein
MIIVIPRRFENENLIDRNAVQHASLLALQNPDNSYTVIKDRVTGKTEITISKQEFLNLLGKHV